MAEIFNFFTFEKKKRQKERKKKKEIIEASTSSIWKLKNKENKNFKMF